METSLLHDNFTTYLPTLRSECYGQSILTALAVRTRNVSRTFLLQCIVLACVADQVLRPG